MHVSFAAVSVSAMLDSSTYQRFIAAPQVIKFSNIIQKSSWCPDEPIEGHLDDNSSVISHQIVHLPLIFANDDVHTVESWVVSILNHAIILRKSFFHKFNAYID